jgi:hypothetical protein
LAYPAGTEIPQVIFDQFRHRRFKATKLGKIHKWRGRIQPLPLIGFTHDCFCPRRLKITTGKRAPGANTADL